MLTNPSFDDRPPLGSKAARSRPARAAASPMSWRALSGAFFIAAVAMVVFVSDASWMVLCCLLAASAVLSFIASWKDPYPSRMNGDGGGYDGYDGE
jgi:hypothetical protein